MGPPSREGTEGEVYTATNRRGRKKRYVYRIDPETGEGQWKTQGAPTAEAAAAARVQNRINYTLTKFSPPTVDYATSGTLRYPDAGAEVGGMTKDSDYVLFQFYEYKPPFQKNSIGGPTAVSPGTGTQFSRDYNQASQYKTAGAGYKSIVMYMPEDISTGFRGNWGGKAISTTGSNLLAGAGASGFQKIISTANGLAGDIGRSKQMLATAAIKRAVQAIGGDNLSNDDVFGSISGAILNPNTELLFASVDMRNFQLNFKLVPRNGTEATTCNEIIKTFKKCTLPKRDPGTVFGFEGASEFAGFIGVPNLCRISFMTGSKEHDVLPRFKMCAVTQVDVNYTPDGSYATYSDGQPVAMTLALNFQETKICFSEEVDTNEVR